MAWSVFWKLKTVWYSHFLNLETKFRLFESCTVSNVLRGWVSAQMNQLISFFATSHTALWQELND